MKESIVEEMTFINSLSKNRARQYAKNGNVTKALKLIKVTKKDFGNNPQKYAEVLAEALDKVDNKLVEVKDTRSEGRKARDWYAKKQGMNVQEKNMFLPKSEEIEEFAKNNNCTVFQAVARMAVI